MRHLAYILIGDPDPDSALTRAETLQAQGYRCIQASDAHSLIGLAGKRMPDVILLGDFPPPTDAVNIAQALKTAEATQNIPIVLTDQSASAALMESARDAQIDDILSPDESDGELTARLPRLTRSSVMVAELGRRVASAKEFGLDVDPRQFRRGYPHEPQVMAVAQDGETLTRLGRMLSETGLHCVPEMSPFRAADRLDEGRYDAAVIAVGKEDDLGRLQYLCGHIRNSPRLFNLPTLVLTEDGQDVEETELYRGGAAIVLSDSAEPETLSTYIHMLVSRQRLRWTLRDPFKATLRDETADVTGVCYSAAFWRTHLARCVRAAGERGGNLSLGYISVPTLPRIREEYGDENAEILAHQLADWIAGMTRIEDTVARVERDAFAILLPDTPEEEANRVVHRIVGILHNSEFHLGEEVMQVIHAWVEAGVSGLRDGDTADGLFARAKDGAF